jgi:hypothetical protein
MLTFDPFRRHSTFSRGTSWDAVRIPGLPISASTSLMQGTIINVEAAVPQMVEPCKLT